ncbi:MAG: Crp/Fnr family transcriptional regulator [Hydrogenophaga sp.]|jgi:CRP-like cAMP-binding protein|nr:Crp/Fnr family transcriptional regulator [Hydrogenophaga sp.]
MPNTKAPNPQGSGHGPTLRCQRCAARQVCRIGQLPTIHLERLDPTIREVDFAKGARLQVQGAGLEVLHAIKLGTVMLSRRGPDLVERPVALLGRGHLLDHGGLLDEPAASSAQALSPGRVCEIPAAALRGQGPADGALLSALLAGMAQTWARLADWGQVVRLSGLQRQLVNTLLLLSEEQGSQTVRLPTHVALAGLLGTSRESVARTLRSLAQDGHLRRIDRWHAELSSSHATVFDEPRGKTR